MTSSSALRSEADRNAILQGDDDTFSVARAALSPGDQPAGHEGTGDIVEHEKTFEGFLSVLAIGVQHIASCLVGLAIGGLEGHWLPALILIALATVAALIGAFEKRVGLKPGAVILAIEVVVWAALA